MAAAARAAEGRTEEAGAAAKLPAARTSEPGAAGTAAIAEAEDKDPGAEAAKTNSGRGHRLPPPRLLLRRRLVEEEEVAGGAGTAAITTSSRSSSARTSTTMTTVRRRLRPGRSLLPIARVSGKSPAAAAADLEGVGAEATVEEATPEADPGKRIELETKTTKEKRNRPRPPPNHPSAAAEEEAEVDRAPRQDARGPPKGIAGNAAGTDRGRLRPGPVRQSQ